jgi:hypothetical protein
VGRMNDNDEFFCLLLGAVLGTVVTGIIYSETRVPKDKVISEKVFILDKATYQCKKTNELKVEE